MPDSNREPCICDHVLGIHHGCCDSSLGYLCELASNGQRSATFRYGNQRCELAQAVQFAQEILSGSSYPLISGLDSLGIRSQQLVVQVAAAAGAVIDTTFSPSRYGSAMSLAREGTVTATLGDLIDRSDLLLIIDCDPEVTHPRIGHWIFKSPSGAKVVVLGDPEFRTAQRADRVIAIAADQIEAALMLLEARIRDLPLASAHSPFSLETMRALDELTGLLLDCRHVGLLTDNRMPSEVAAFDSAQDSVTSLVGALNERVRAVSLELRGDRNAVAAENVLSWSTGFPLAVDLSDHPPKACHTEYAANSVLGRQECDAAFLFQSQPHDLASLDPDSLDYLASIPCVLITHGVEDAAATPLAKGKAPQLQANNLRILPDDFARCDDLLVTVESRSTSPAPELRYFLKELLREIRILRC